MDGEAYTPTGRPEAREVSKTSSTPVSEREGSRVELDLVALSRYTVNVRSFHPNPQFEPGGFRFEGDDRGFSTGSSYFGRRPPSGAVTSRIWQRYELDMASSPSDEAITQISDLRQESNPSSPGPGAWGLFGSTEDYEDPEFKPTGTLSNHQFPWVAATRSPDTQHIVGRRSSYGGLNFAFRGSRLDQRTLGTTVVPSLDVISELHIRLERVGHYMDIVSLVYGDGFPNCEAFLEDKAGNKLKLGSHVRIGLPSTHLFGANQRLFWANALRVRLDPQGNFKEELGVFSRISGGPSTLRDKHPILSIDEFHSRRNEPRVMGINVGVASSYSMWWNYARPTDIAGRDAAGIGREPLRVSSFSSIEEIRAQLASIWTDGKHFRTARDSWTDYHTHRDPNGGRSPDHYDLDPQKWQRS